MENYYIYIVFYLLLFSCQEISAQKEGCFQFQRISKELDKVDTQFYSLCSMHHIPEASREFLKDVYYPYHFRNRKKTTYTIFTYMYKFKTKKVVSINSHHPDIFSNIFPDILLKDGVALSDISIHGRLYPMFDLTIKPKRQFYFALDYYKGVLERKEKYLNNPNYTLYVFYFYHANRENHTLKFLKKKYPKYGRYIWTIDKEPAMIIHYVDNLGVVYMWANDVKTDGGYYKKAPSETELRLINIDGKSLEQAMKENYEYFPTK